MVEAALHLLGYVLGIAILVAIPFLSSIMARTLDEAQGWIMVLLYVLAFLGMAWAFGLPQTPNY